MNRFATAILLLAAVAGVATSALAHNLWILADGQTIRVIFEHAPAASKGNYNSDILRGGRTWARTPDATAISPIHASETGEPGARFMTGTTTAKGPRAIEHACVFGLYNGRLDHFYGKFLDVSSAGELNALSRAPDLDLDIVPELAGRTLRLKVLWKGEQLTGHKFGVIDTDGVETVLEPDARGVVAYTPPKNGTYHFWAVRIEDESRGMHEGRKYFGTMQGTTLTLRLPIN